MKLHYKTQPMIDLIKRLSAKWKEDINLTNEKHQQLVIQQAEFILGKNFDYSELEKLDVELATLKEEFPIGVKLALKLAISKSFTNAIKIDTLISFVFAVYNEHNRMQKPSGHPNGEDLLSNKINQLNWLCKDNPKLRWQMFVVDDGCPNGSGDIAHEILQDNYPNVHVVFLEDGIKNKHPAVHTLNSTNESRKGASIQYGMALAAESGSNKNHIIIFTDADLSTHLGQAGLLVKPIINMDKKVSIASRREVNSVVIKKGLRNTRGKLFIYLWKRLLPELNYIIDTQCGFKAFSADHLKKIIYDADEKKFAFDIELLLKSELLQKNSIEKIAIAWIDSDAESTTGGNTYLDMLHSIVKMYRRYIPANPEADSWANFIKNLGQEDWDHLLDNMPEVIAEANPSNLNRKLVKVELLTNIKKP